jgi:signal transduction histidine kinase
MSRLRHPSIRARLTIAFSVALMLVLIAAAVFVYLRVDSALTESADESLQARIAALRGIVSGTPSRSVPKLRTALDSEDNFSQILDQDGRLLSSTLPPGSGTALDPRQAEQAAQGELLLPTVSIAGVDGDARVLAAPANERALVVVAGSANQDRSEALSRMTAAFAVGAPLALVLSAAAGYLLARRALLPVEAMRARADGISGEGGEERLPLPAADDELRALALTLNSMLERLEGALEREKAFVADASHELRTPLSVLKAELELADHGARSPDELRAAIRSALGEVDRLARLADDLLIAARADRGQIPIRRESIEVGRLLGRVINRFDRQAADGGRRIELSADPELRAAIDPLRAEQAVGNLIDNALRHGSGVVNVAARTGSHGELLIEVGDQGAGFPPSFRERAFERFSRADTGRATGGAGLGLSIVAAIARAHGGDAEIVPGPPSVVRISFAGAARIDGSRRALTQPT